MTYGLVWKTFDTLLQGRKAEKESREAIYWLRDLNFGDPKRESCVDKSEDGDGKRREGGGGVSVGRAHKAPLPPIIVVGGTLPLLLRKASPPRENKAKSPNRLEEK